MDELYCPVPECNGNVIKVSIETYEEAMYLDDDGEITESEADERERTDCSLDHFYCGTNDAHQWQTFEELERAVKEVA